MSSKVVTRRAWEDWKLFAEQIELSTPVSSLEKPEVQQARQKRALKDYNYFCTTYFPLLCSSPCAPFHTEFAQQALKAYKNNLTAQMVAEWPREHAKSIHLTVILPMWLLAHGFLRGMVLIGKNEDDASNLLGDVQAQLQYNQLFAHDFGDSYSYGTWEVGDFTTKNGVRFLACGRGQSPRGVRKGDKRPNYGVADDIDDDEIVNNPRRVSKVLDVLLGALWFALDTRCCLLTMAGNRIHAQSILANFVGDTKPGAKKRDGLTYHSKVFAIDPKTGEPAWPQRYTLKQLEAKMAGAGTLMARREFFHENHVQGTIFKDDYIQWRPMQRQTWKTFPVIIGYFDPSYENKATSDFKAVRVWSVMGNLRYCLGSFVQRTGLMEVYRWMSQFEDECPAGVKPIWYVENQFFNRPIQDALRAHNQLRLAEGKTELYVIRDMRAKENKYTRIVRMEPEYSLGHVFYNLAELHNASMIEGNNQLKGIEPGYNTPDDSPDADEGAWFHLNPFIPNNSFTPRFSKKTINSKW